MSDSKSPDLKKKIIGPFRPIVKIYFTFVFNKQRNKIKMEQSELIIRLIKDDLKNQSLINSFQALGFYSEDHYLNLSETIFKVLDIENNEELFELYVQKCTDIEGVNIIKDWELLERRAEEIYRLLVL
jgi:hypothetical protein